LPKRLALRLIVSLTLLVAAAAAVSAWINVRIKEREFLHEVTLATDQISRALTRATWEAMLADNRPAAYRILQTVGSEPGIERIRIFNKEGWVTFSTHPGEPRQVDTTAEACFLCHAARQPLVRVDVPSRARVFRGPDGDRRLGMVTPIYNEPACSNAPCHAHPASRSVLGVLDVTVPLTRIDREVVGFKLRSASAALLVIVLIGLFIVYFSRRFVDRPIHKLIEASRAISAMDLDQPVVVDAAGELQELAASFNTMRERLKTAIHDLHAATRDLERTADERGRQLLVAQRRLIQSDRQASLGQLAASVAHEINNPVAGVLNLSHLMRRLLRDDGVPAERLGEFRRYLDQIIAETTRVGRIVADLLAFSRRSSPQSAPADLNEIVRSTLSLLAHKLDLLGVRQELALNAALPQAVCDRSQIQQVVTNLVMNAAEAMPQGGTVTVATAIANGGGSVSLRVTDTGVGIPEERLARIFDPFFTTKEEGKGVGLGLAVVYGIVQAHGGAVDVQSRPGEGTAFIVILPIAGPAHAAAA
jgi:two-component system NtrC family sensor kinase